jgi:hypothetical protein
MDEQWIILTLAATLFAVGIALIWRPVMTAWRETRLAEARRGFHRQRERLEAKFVQLGLAGNRADAPRWTDCEFDDDVAYVRSRSTGELSAFVAVTIAMEEPDDDAIPGTAIGNYRAATAVFRFDRDHWVTDGRAIFNLTPSEAIRFYQGDLEVVGQDNC